MTILERPPWPVTDRAALAALVAHPTDPHARALDTENRNAGRLPGIAEADDLGAAYMVNVAPDVLALDVDTCEAADPAALRTAAEALADQLDADGWPVLRVASGRPGNWHLWAVIPDPDALDRAKFDATVAGLAPRAVMRPPGAPHRLGHPVRVLDDPAAFTDAVEAVRTAEAADRATIDRGRYDWRRILATGKLPASLANVPPGCGPGWWCVWWIAVGAARSGLTVDQLRAELAKPANLGGAAYRRRLTRNATGHADHWLDAYVWPKATQVARKRPNTPADATEARHQLDAIRAAVEAHPWQGIAGTTDRAVLVALLDRAHTRGSLTPTMSHRELAEAAPCTRRTVHTAVRRLRAAGWLLVAEQGRGATDVDADGARRERANATRWRLRLPVGLRARAFPTGGTPPARTSLSGASARAGLDACRWRGVGLNAPRVLDALDAEGPMTSRALADRLGLSWGNLRARLLPRMAGLGLLVRGGDAYALADDLDAALAGAAVTLGLNGKADEVAAKHAAERAGYLEHRERTRPDRERARRRTMAAKRTATSSTAPTLPLDVPVAPVPSSEPMTGPHPPPDPLDATPPRLTVSHNLVRVTKLGLIRGETKTVGSRRRIQLPAPVVDALRRHRVAQLEERMLVGAEWPDRPLGADLVFRAPFGTAMDPDNFRQHIYRVTAECFTPPEERPEPGRAWPTKYRRSPHQLRHSAASLLIAQGVPMKLVSEVLGHSSIRVTADVYGHLYDEAGAVTADAMTAALWGAEG